MTEYFTGPRQLPPDFDVDAHLARLDEDGFTLVEDYMSEDQLARFREGGPKSGRRFTAGIFMSRMRSSSKSPCRNRANRC